MRRFLFPLAAIAVTAIALASGSPVSAGVRSVSGWTPLPVGLKSGVLYDIDAKAGEAWTVGISITMRGKAMDFHPLAMRKTRSGWASTPQPTDLARLDDVAVRGQNDVWAVGGYEPDATPLLQHWDGQRWSVIPGPATAPEGFSSAFTSVGLAGSDAWVLGWHTETEDELHVPDVFRYRDGRWDKVITAGLDGLTPQKIVPLTSDDVWVAGLGGVAHFDGRAWTRSSLPGVGERLSIESLEVRSSKDIWAVGMEGDDLLWRKPLALHYDGRAWTKVPTPSETGQLFGIGSVGGRLIAVGEDPFTNLPYTLRLESGRFVRAADPAGAGSLLGSEVAGGKLWAVGVAERTDWTVPQDPYIASWKR